MILAISPAGAAEVSGSTGRTHESTEALLGDKTSASDVEAVLGFIESIPESALVDDATFDRWKKDNLDDSRVVGPPASAVAAGGVEVYASGGECAWGITKFALGNAFAAAKVLKIKKVLDRAGGGEEGG